MTAQLIKPRFSESSIENRATYLLDLVTVAEQIVEANGEAMPRGLMGLMNIICELTDELGAVISRAGVDELLAASRQERVPLPGALEMVGG